jgi:hypothetical protein
MSFKMKFSNALSFLAVLFYFNTAFTLNAQEQNKEIPKWIEFHGFVSYEMMYDTRQSVAAREGEVYLFPKPVEYDQFGNDINDHGKFQMFTFHTRLKAAIKGPDIKNMKTSGAIEFDFLGTNDGTVNLIRMRHAYLKLASDKVEWLMGQYWHPMFVPECFPMVVSWGASVPVHVLSRNPQLRFTFKPTKKVSLMASVLSQRDFVSSGPDGNSSEYLKNSQIPEVQFQFMTKPSDKFVAGFTAGYKTLFPRLVTDSNYVYKESIGSYNFNLFSRYMGDKFDLKLQGIYGQNLNSLLLIGGYAVSEIDPQYDQRKYVNLHTFSAWTELVFKLNSVKLGLFAAYTKNLGAQEDLTAVNDVYGLGTNINYMYRISPRVIYEINKLKFSLELYTTAASYGDFDIDLSIVNDDEVINHRILFSAMLSF